MRYVLLVSMLVTTVLAASPEAAQDKRPGRRSSARPGPPYVIERLNRMTPEQRQRALDRLSPERRKKVEERLERFNSLPPRVKHRLREQYDTFQKLPPEKQEAIRRSFREMNGLSQERRIAVRREVMRLRGMTLEERTARMDTDNFRSHFSEPERQLVRDLAEAIPVSRDPEP